MDTKIELCCQDQANREEIERRRIKNERGEETAQVIVTRCRICLRKHVLMTVVPVEVKPTGADVQ